MDADRRRLTTYGAEQLLKREEPVLRLNLWQELAPYAAELVGTFLLTITFLLNFREHSDSIWAVGATGFMNMVLVYALRHTSGANLNPSITIALVLARRHRITVGAKLCLAQICGAIAAGVLHLAVGNSDVTVGANPGFNMPKVALIEVLYTTLLCFVYLNCVASVRNNPADDPNGFFGLALGFCYIAGGYAGRAVSHVVMNSAVAISITIVDSRTRFSAEGLEYFVFDIVGAFLGAGLYRLVRPEELDPVNILESNPHKGSRAAMAEFIGTFYVVLTKSLNRVSDSTLNGTEAWSVTAVIAALVYSLRDVSGGSFNPAVTVSVALSRRGLLDVLTAMRDIFIQIMAGIFATAIFAVESNDKFINVRFGSTYSPSAMAFGECLFTCLTCYVVLCTSTTRPVESQTRCNNIAGFAYGACHVVGGVAIGNISGGMLNPAVVIAFNGLNATKPERGHSSMVYIFWQIVGAVLATAVFAVTHWQEYMGPKAERNRARRRSWPTACSP